MNNPGWPPENPPTIVTYTYALPMPPIDLLECCVNVENSV